MRLTLVSLTLLCTLGCASAVNNFTVNRVLDRGLAVADLGQVCETGASLRHSLAALPSAKNPPHEGLVIAETAGALCAELEAFEAALDEVRVKRNYRGIEDRVAEVKDASIQERRLHGIAADRFYRAYLHTEAAFGAIGEERCPRVPKKQEVTYLLGLYAGMSAVLHDKASGTMVGVPLDVVGKVSRSAMCVDDATWWGVPGALQAAGWAVVPGSGPEDVDAWEVLEKQATSGALSGVRLARALQVKLAANAGKDEIVENGLTAIAESLGSVPRSADFAFFDRYAEEVALHESDLIWIAEAGYRTATLGELPQDPSEEAASPFGDDPFGGDPFGGGGDPFAEPSEEPAPAEASTPSSPPEGN